MLIEINNNNLPFAIGATQGTGRACFEGILDMSDNSNRNQLQQLRRGDLLIGINGYNCEQSNSDLVRSLLATPTRPLRCTFVRPIQVILSKEGALGLSLAVYQSRVYINQNPTGQSRKSAVQKGMLLMDIQTTNVTGMTLSEVLNILSRAGRPLYLNFIATNSNDEQLQNLLTNAPIATVAQTQAAQYNTNNSQRNENVPGPPPKGQSGIAKMSGSTGNGNVPGPPPKGQSGIARMGGSSQNDNGANGGASGVCGVSGASSASGASGGTVPGPPPKGQSGITVPGPPPRNQTGITAGSNPASVPVGQRPTPGPRPTKRRSQTESVEDVELALNQAAAKRAEQSLEDRRQKMEARKKERQQKRDARKNELLKQTQSKSKSKPKPNTRGVSSNSNLSSTSTASSSQPATIITKVVGNMYLIGITDFLHQTMGDELNFHKNDVITIEGDEITKYSDPDIKWCKGRIGDRIGVFPQKFTKIVKDPGKELRAKTPYGARGSSRDRRYSNEPSALDTLATHGAHGAHGTHGQSKNAPPKTPRHPNRKKKKKRKPKPQPRSQSKHSELYTNISSSSATTTSTTASTTASTATSKPTPKPRTRSRSKEKKSKVLKPTKAIALTSFQQQDEGDELNFQKGDIIILMKSDDDVWGKGMLEGTSYVGVFPLNFVQILPQEEEDDDEDEEIVEDEEEKGK